MGSKSKSKTRNVIVKLDDGSEFLVEVRISPLKENA